MVKGRMVFMRFNDDHHGLGLVGQGGEISKQRELHHLAFEVPTIDEVFRARDYLTKNGVTVDFHGRRRAGSQVSVEFRDPDGHALEIFWGLDKVDWDGKARPPEEWVPKHTLEEAVDHAPPGQDTTLADPSLRQK
jgi:catechol 2,3-dioxygenase